MMTDDLEKVQNLLIVHIAKHPMSGVWASMKSLINAQVRQGKHAVFVGIFPKSTWPEHYDIELNELPCCTFRQNIGNYKMSYVSLMFLHNLKARIEQMADEIQPDRIVLHFHNSDFSAVFLRPWMKCYKYNLVVTFHGMPGIDSKFARRRGWQKFLHNRLLSYSAKLVSVDRLGINQAKDVLGYSGDDFTAVIPNGLAASRREIKPRNDFDRVNVGFVGNIDDNKGWELVVEAVDIAYESSVPLLLNIAGDGPGRDALLRLIRPKAEYIQYHGEMINARSELIAKMDLVVMASKVEGFPMVLLEAMSEGVAIISTRVGAIDELVEHGAHIAIVKRNVESIAQGIVALWNDRANIDKLRKCNLTCFLVHYEINSVAARYNKIYCL